MTDVRFLVFDTEAEADQWQRAIFLAGKALAAGAGMFTADGVIHALRAGVSDANTRSLTSYAVPRQRLDGKWAFSHPENYPVAASNPEALAQLQAAFDAAGITAEIWSADWWPQED